MSSPADGDGDGDGDDHDDDGDQVESTCTMIISPLLHHKKITSLKKSVGESVFEEL